MARILVVDDDIDLSEVIGMMLDRGGHDVFIANDGKEGLEAIQNQTFDLIVLDVMMPDMDGYEVTRQLRADPRTKDQLVLILTARAQDVDRQAAFEAGADDFLAKPVPPQELNKKVVELLAGSSKRRTEGAAADDDGAKGRLINTLSLRGGTGQTTFAVNLALALTRQQRRVCLLDLSPNGGHVTLQLGLRNAPSWVYLSDEFVPQDLSKVLVRHTTGLFVLSAPAQPQLAGLSAMLFSSLRLALQSAFTDLVIDGANWADEATRAACTHASRLFIVLAPEVGAVQTAVGTLAMFRDSDIDLTNLHFVLNQPDPRPSVPRAAIEKALGRPITLELPYETLQQKALMKGLPLMLSAPNQPYVAGINKVADLS